MTEKQQSVFWNIIRKFNELGILQYVVVIGSWAEYLYQDLFGDSYVASLKTRDIDFVYRNINKPVNAVSLVEELKSIGFSYAEDSVTGTSKFYSDDDSELEFIAKSLGSGTQSQVKISALGIVVDSLRDVNLLDAYTCEVKKNGFTILVPEPAVFVIHKIVINEHRVPVSKKPKDIEAVEHLLPFIKSSYYHQQKFVEIYDRLSKKQKSSFWKTVLASGIDVDGLLGREERSKYYSASATNKKECREAIPQKMDFDSL